MEYPSFSRQRRTYPVEVQVRNRNKKFNVHVQWTMTVNFIDLYRYLQEGGAECPREGIMNLEILLRHSASKDPNCFVSGRSIYFDDQRTKKDLPGMAELWLGYHQSVKPCQSGICLNIDTTCTAFMKKGPIIDYLLNISNQVRSIQDLSRLLGDGKNVRKLQSLSRSIKGLMVIKNLIKLNLNGFNRLSRHT